MNIHIVHFPVLQSLASQIRMCACRKAKWLTNDTKINRFWVLNPGQKGTKWFLRMLFLELNISSHPLQNSFPPRRHKFSPGNSSIRSRGFMFFGSELPLSLYFPVLLLGTRSLEIKALGTATRGRRHLWSEAWGAEPPSHKRGGLRRVSVSQICRGSPLSPAGPYLTMGLSTDLNISQIQYRNKIQTELF